jgi:hypothetical protein
MPVVTKPKAFAAAAVLGLLVAVLSVIAPSAGGSGLPALARGSAHATVSDHPAPRVTWPVGLLAQPRAAVPTAAAVAPLALLRLALALLPLAWEPAQPLLAVAVPSATSSASSAASSASVSRAPGARSRLRMRSRSSP